MNNNYNIGHYPIIIHLKLCQVFSLLKQLQISIIQFDKDQIKGINLEVFHNFIQFFFNSQKNYYVCTGVTNNNKKS
jgi:hypothetical protein